MKLGLLIPLIVPAILSGCSTTISSYTCADANWQIIGWQDGQKGLDSARVKSYIEDCSGSGNHVDHLEWERGRKLGLMLYCSPNNGYWVGVTGKPYLDICPNSAFTEKYKAGQKEYLRLH